MVSVVASPRLKSPSTLEMDSAVASPRRSSPLHPNPTHLMSASASRRPMDGPEARLPGGLDEAKTVLPKAVSVVCTLNDAMKTRLKRRVINPRSGDFRY